MYVRMLDGAHAGQIVDLRNDVALEFTRQGRAEPPFANPAPRVPHVVAAAEAAAPQSVPAGKSGKKKKGR